MSGTVRPAFFRTNDCGRCAEGPVPPRRVFYSPAPVALHPDLGPTDVGPLCQGRPTTGPDGQRPARVRDPQFSGGTPGKTSLAREGPYGTVSETLQGRGRGPDGMDCRDRHPRSQDAADASVLTGFVSVCAYLLRIPPLESLSNLGVLESRLGSDAFLSRDSLAQDRP